MFRNGKSVAISDDSTIFLDTQNDKMYWNWKSPHRSAVQVNFVSEDDERKVVWIAGGGLDEELVAPAIQRLEGGGRGHVVDLQDWTLEA